MSTDYRARVQRAIAFICEHLDEPLQVAEVAEVAHLSEFHFHRIFSAVVGEPIGRFITRRRLETAALRLAYEPNRSVTHVALSSGYSSVSNFSKAFAAYFGCSPSQVREGNAEPPAMIGRLTRLYGKAFRATDLYTLPPEGDEGVRRRELDVLNAQVRFETCAGFDVVCLAGPGGYATDTLEQTWAECIARVRQIGLTDGAVDAFGMVYDSPQLTAPELCRYHACVPCPSSVAVAPPLFRGQVPAGRYAIFPYHGHVDGVEAMYRRVYSLWLPDSSLAPDDFVAIDHYINDGPVRGAIDMEIWIKVRPKGTATSV